LVLKLIPSRQLSCAIVFVGNFTHLMLSYYIFATENYDIDFTTAQSVLTLRLIGFGWDYFDGGKKEDKLEHDQKLNGLKQLPSLLETYSYCYFFGGFLIGPQFPFRLYRQFFNGELFRGPDGKDVIPSNFVATLRCIALGALYLGFNNALSPYFPGSYLYSEEFLHKISLFWRFVYIWVISKITMSKYLGVWLVGEGPCTLVGLNFGGYNKDGTHKGWRSLSNVNPWLYETSLNLQGIVESFNINTNDWSKRYIFKRLKWVGDRNISALSTLAFLAIWHGFYVGYLLCFFLEFVDMQAEGKLKRLTDPVNKLIEAHPEMGVLKWFWNVGCYLLRSMALHYGMASFEVKTLQRSLAIYQSVYYIPHILPALMIVLDIVIPKRKEKKVE